MSYFIDGAARVDIVSFTGGPACVGDGLEIEVVVPGVPRNSRTAWIRLDQLVFDEVPLPDDIVVVNTNPET